jgi:hypothetical protein
MNMTIGEKMRGLVVIILSTFTLGSAARAWTTESAIYLDNTSVENINIDESSLSVLVSYPGKSISGVCSIEIVADSYRRERSIESLIAELDFTNPFGPGEVSSKIQVVSDKVARFALIPEIHLDGFVLSPRNKTLTLRELIEQILGKDRKVVVMPRSC